MFLKIGSTILNTGQIVAAKRATGGTVFITVAEITEGGYSGTYHFIGAEAEALWDYLCSPVLCTDVLADVPAPVRP